MQHADLVRLNTSAVQCAAFWEVILSQFTAQKDRGVNYFGVSTNHFHVIMVCFISILRWACPQLMFQDSAKDPAKFSSCNMPHHSSIASSTAAAMKEGLQND